MVVAYLAVQLLLTPGKRSLNPNIGKYFILSIAKHRKGKNREKDKKRPGYARLQKITLALKDLFNVPLGPLTFFC